MNNNHHWIERFGSPKAPRLQPIDFITFLILVILITLASVVIVSAFNTPKADIEDFQSVACMVFGEIPERPAVGFHETQAADDFHENQICLWAKMIATETYADDTTQPGSSRGNTHQQPEAELLS
ncbi:hypothetical protein [Rubellicoccus peritrichatus]|uniref:Uncharacterized protein n=1 Tax=Rubellicoccus peritrichatus TaxID=3080537 RepID=A0AAQ3LFY8_9BACT|nr:hypothetical protein [Puniceicoccus sp. CR14]WOO43135.1 hypothetical protein RZN69_08520 [Puniceicoccus sp. CR14]